MDNNKKRNDMNGEKVIDLLWEVKEGKKHPNKAYKELCVLFNVSNSIKVDPSKVIKTSPRMIREDFRDTK